MSSRRWTWGAGWAALAVLIPMGWGVLWPPPGPAAAQTAPAPKPKPKPDTRPAMTEPPPEWVPANRRWQRLPANVDAARCGPDGRWWLDVRAPSDRKVGPEAIRVLIERQWRQRFIQVPEWRTVLLEPAGRVWLLSRDHRTLLAYDGRQWLEPRPSPPWIRPDQPPREDLGGGWGAAQVVLAADRVFVSQTGGVQVFDGQTWTFQPMCSSTAPSGPERAVGWMPATIGQLLAEPDGQGVLAVYHRGGHNGWCWRWRNGQWAQTPVPSRTLDGDKRVVVPLPGGVALCSDARGPPLLLQLVVADAARARAFENALQNLNSQSPRVREAALGAISEAVEAGLPADVLQKASTHVKDPAVLQRLLAAVDRPAGPARLGDWQIEEVYPQPFEVDGRVLIPGRFTSPESGQGTPGVLFLDATRPDAKPVLIQDPALSSDAPESERGLDVAATLVRGKSLLLSRRGWTDHFELHVLDYTQPTPHLRPFPFRDYMSVLGSDGRGALALLAREGAARMFHQPEAPDDAVETLTAQTSELAAGLTHLDAQGNLWAMLVDGSIARYDGEHWQDHWAPGELDLRHTDTILGERAVLGLRWMVDDWGTRTIGPAQLRTPQHAWSAPTLRALIAAHPGVVAQAFPARSDRAWRTEDPTLSPVGQERYGLFALATDPAGRLWLLEDGRLRVWVDDEWREFDQESAAAATGARLKTTLPLFRCLMPLDGGQRFYIATTSSNASYSLALVAELRGRQLALTPAPLSYWQPVPDGHGGLYLSVPGADAKGSYSEWNGSLQHLAPDGRTVTPLGRLRLRMVDPIGRAWVTPLTLGVRHDAIEVRHGQARQVPGFEEVPLASARLFADGPRSVWTWSPFELVHYRAASDDPADLRRVRTLRPLMHEEAGSATARTFAGRWPILVSPRGFVATLSYTPRLPEGRRYWLHVLKLPTD